MGLLSTLLEKRRLVSPALLRRKPLLFVNALWQLSRQRLTGKRRIKGVMLALHYKCNLKCEHCYEKRLRQPSSRLLSLDEKRNVIRQCRELGVLAFDFIGGESHLSPDFEQLVRETYPATHYVTLCTNGVGFDRETIARYRRIGVDKFNISLDSWDAAEHDRFRRREGAHREALETIRLCRELGVDVTISVVIQNGTTRQQGFRDLVAYVVEKRISLACKLAVPVGNWEGELATLASDEDKREIERLHAENPFITRDVHANGGNCPALSEFCSITAYGDVMPCNAIQISIGNLREMGLAEILDGEGARAFCSEFHAGCPPAEDRAFISRYLAFPSMEEGYPVRYDSLHGGSEKASGR